MAKIKKEIKQEPLEIVLWKAADKLRKNIDAAEWGRLRKRKIKHAKPVAAAVAA